MGQIVDEVMKKLIPLLCFAFHLVMLITLTICFAHAVFVKDASGLTMFITFYGAGYFGSMIFRGAVRDLDILQERPPK